jgi:hypothetical protein
MINILKYFYWSLFFSFLCYFATTHANEVRPFGHNVSQTDYLPENTCSIGSQIALCSNGEWGVGTVPFLLTTYNMNSVVVRKRFQQNEKTTHSIQAAYFKTIEQEKETYEDEWGQFEFTPGYDQEAYWLTYIYSHQYSPTYRMHLNVSGQNYTYDRQPFSLRRPTVSRNPFQLNITSLHEGMLTKRFGIMGEFGALHLTDKYPRIHTGASLFYKRGGFYAQVGFSMTSTYISLFEGRRAGRIDYQAELQSYEEGFNQPMDEEKIRNDFSIHPEFVIQYQF